MAGGVANLIPWVKGQTGNPGGLTKNERALKNAIDSEEVPKVMRMLSALRKRGLRGDVAAARLWLEQVRPIAKASQQSAVDAAVRARFEELVSEARQRIERRAAGAIEVSPASVSEAVGPTDAGPTDQGGSATQPK